ncbi:hypothetical protein AX17_002788 [Amanita inopinata Kibby_2008]|nr:hypothetical protein AX17_002788 [Amanita inopinata Kibby_2008]
MDSTDDAEREYLVFSSCSSLSEGDVQRAEEFLSPTMPTKSICEKWAQDHTLGFCTDGFTIAPQLLQNDFPVQESVDQSSNGQAEVQSIDLSNGGTDENDPGATASLHAPVPWYPGNQIPIEGFENDASQSEH